MRLNEIPAGGLEATRYAERYVNTVKGEHSKYSDTSVEYSPHEGIDEFAAPVFYMKPEDVRVLQADPNPDLAEEVMSDDVVFIAHPEMLQHQDYLEKTGLDPKDADTERYTVTPTSSTRTLLTKDLPENFMAKTDLDRRHYKYIRRLKGSSVEHSVAISAEFDRLAADGLLPEEFAYMPESIGVTIGDHEKGAGVVYREPEPRPHAPDKRTLIPYFSLYAKDLKNLDDLTIMEQLVREHAKPGEELDFFVDALAGKAIRSWVKVVRNTGLLPELHSQNALLEIDEDLMPQRVVYRDFQSTYIDAEIREANGMDVPFTKHIAGTEEGTDKARQYSYVYDDSVGHFNLEKLTDSFTSSYPRYSTGTVESELRRIFRKEFPFSDVFPEAAYRATVIKDNDVSLDLSPHQRLFR